MQMNFEQQRQMYLQAIEENLSQCFRWPDEPQQQLFEAMRYSLLAGGKRLRPMLVLEFCRLAGGQWQQAMPFALGIEMVHTYSLIHDDLPCMDDDDYRRGRLTSHKVYGEANAVLAGDALLTEAFAAVSSAELPPQQVVQAVQILSRAAGATGMVGGQVLDLAAEGRACLPQDVEQIHTRKTGALILAACQLGVAAAAGSPEQMEQAGVYARNIGLAFQIRDDMLDVIGSQEKLGKATGMDGQKNTFVSLYGLPKCQELVDKYTAAALQALQSFDGAEFVCELSRRLMNRDH